MKITTALQVSRARAESWRLLFAARSAVEECKANLWQQAYGAAWATGEAVEPVEGQAGQGLFAAPEPWKTEYGGVAVEVFFEDEAGKVPINDLYGSSPERSKALSLVLARLFDELDLPNPTSFASVIRDFIDSDDDGTRETGARNERIFHLGELLAARGADFDTLYVPRREEHPSAAQCLSTWHTGPVNVNGAPAAVLAALAPRLTASEISEIIVLREERPFSSVDDFRQRLSLSGDVQEQLLENAAFGTDTLSLYVEARAGAFVRRVKAVVWVQSAKAHTLYFGEGWDF